MKLVRDRGVAGAGGGGAAVQPVAGFRGEVFTGACEGVSGGGGGLQLIRLRCDGSASGRTGDD